MTQFSGQFTITKKDNLAFNFFLMRKKLIATSIMVFVVIAGMVGVLKYAQGAGLKAAILSALLMSLMGTLLLIAINVVVTIVRINTFYKNKKLTDFSVSFQTDKSGIHALSDRGDFDLAWNRIVEVRETKQAFYIFITDSHANVIPKDQIVNQQDIGVFRALLIANVEKARLKLLRG